MSKYRGGRSMDGRKKNRGKMRMAMGMHDLLHETEAEYDRLSRRCDILAEAVAIASYMIRQEDLPPGAWPFVDKWLIEKARKEIEGGDGDG